MTDPIWPQRCSPLSWAAPLRHQPPGIRLEDPFHFLHFTRNLIDKQFSVAYIHLHTPKKGVSYQFMRKEKNMNKKIAFIVLMFLHIYMATMAGTVLAEETHLITWKNGCFATGCSQFTATIITQADESIPFEDNQPLGFLAERTLTLKSPSCKHVLLRATCGTKPEIVSSKIYCYDKCSVSITCPGCPPKFGLHVP